MTRLLFAGDGNFIVFCLFTDPVNSLLPGFKFLRISLSTRRLTSLFWSFPLFLDLSFAFHVRALAFTLSRCFGYFSGPGVRMYSCVHQHCAFLSPIALSTKMSLLTSVADTQVPCAFSLYACFHLYQTC